jgi:single-strand DNA-binding protein
MEGFSKTQLIGRVGSEVEIRTVGENNTQVSNFSFVVNENERTTWYRVAAWGGLAKVAKETFQKGRPLYLEGRVYLDEYTDRDNVRHARLAMSLSEFCYLDAKRKSGETDEADNAAADEPEGDK